MRRSFGRCGRPAVAGLILAMTLVLAAPSAFATVRVSRAELDGTKLRIEGTAAPNRTITVDGVAMGTSDAAGAFRIDRDPFAKPADCIVDVNDGSASATPASLSGCTTNSTPPPGSTGSISIVPGGNGSGRVTSQPAGVNCTITLGNGSGTCTAVFPAGTVVRLDARPADNSKFLGFRGTPGCFDPSKITVAANTTISCQPGFQLR